MNAAVPTAGVGHGGKEFISERAAIAGLQGASALT